MPYLDAAVCHTAMAGACCDQATEDGVSHLIR